MPTSNKNTCIFTYKIWMFIYLQISKLLQSSNSYIITVQYQNQYSKLPNI